MRKTSAQILFVVVAAALVLVAGCSRGGRETTTVLQTIPNGITIAVKENYGSGVVAVQLWVRDGALFETPNEAGTANVLREMMFVQTEGGEPGDLFGDIEALGGSLTSSCRHDFVEYAAIVPADYFDQLLAIVHDGFTGSVLNDDILERAKERAISSIGSMSKGPVDRAYRLCLREIMKGHPYGRLPVGDPDSISKLTLEDIEQRYAERYVGSNLLIAVSGSIDAVEAADRVADVFSDIEKGTRAQPAAPPVTWPTESSRIEERTGIKRPVQVVGFPGPGVSDQDSVTMDVLLVILMDGRSSRLNSRLKEELGLVQAIGAGWYTQHQPSPLFVWMDLPEENIDAAEQAVVDLLGEFATEQVGEDELAKAKILLETGNLRMVETAEGRAFHLGYWNSIGGEDFAAHYLERLSQTTAEEIQAAAARYFGSGVHVAAVLLPE